MHRDKRNLSSRRAFSLVELLAVSVLMAVVLTIIGTVMTSLLKANGNLRRHQTHLAALSEISAAWRTDVAQAVDITTDFGTDDKVALFTLPGEQAIVYRREETELTRTRYQQGKPTHAWQFTLAANFSAQCELIDDRRIASLTLQHPLVRIKLQELQINAATTKEVWDDAR